MKGEGAHIVIDVQIFPKSEHVRRRVPSGEIKEAAILLCEVRLKKWLPKEAVLFSSACFLSEADGNWLSKFRRGRKTLQPTAATNEKDTMEKEGNGENEASDTHINITIYTFHIYF